MLFSKKQLNFWVQISLLILVIILGIAPSARPVLADAGMPLQLLVYDAHPANMSCTYNHAPVMSASFDLGQATLSTQGVQIDLDGQSVASAAYINIDSVARKGTVTYQPASILAAGEHQVAVSVTDAAYQNATYSWSFTVIDALTDPHFYYGVPHAHTSISDGKGTPGDAYQHAFDKGLDFLVLTDHSNYFTGDKYVAATNDFEPQPGSAWYNTGVTASNFNQQHPGFLALRGFEMTSDTWGHINVHNTSRYVEGKKTMTSLGDFYNWLEQQSNSVGAFNHPMWPDDSFNDLAYVPAADHSMKLIDVENGVPPTLMEEYFYRALDNGWHVAPINSQDNHLMNWGDADNLTVVVADQLTSDSYIQALQQRRVYSTDSRTLQMTVKANGYWMGNVLDLSVGDRLDFNISVSDSVYPISKLELITNLGQVVDTLSADGQKSVTWQPSVTPGYGDHWYVVKVYLQSGRLGFSSPIFTATGQNDVRLVNLKVNPDPTLLGSTATITAAVADLGERPADNLTVKFFHDKVSDNNLIGTASVAHLGPGERQEVQANWKPSAAVQTSVYAELTGIPGVTTITELSRQTTVVVMKNVRVRVEGATQSKVDTVVQVAGTAMDALNAAVGASNVVAPGGFFTSILGESGQTNTAPNTRTDWMYYVIRNGTIEPTAFSMGAGSYNVADGDEVVFYIGASDTQTWSPKTYFPVVTVSPAKPVTGQALTLNIAAKKYDWMSGLVDLSPEEVAALGDYTVTANGATCTSKNGQVLLANTSSGDLNYTVSNPNPGGYPNVVTLKGRITVGGPNSSGSGGAAPTPQPVTSTTGSAALSPSAGGTVGLGSEASVTIPAGALNGASDAKVTVEKLSTPPAVASGFKALGSVFEFSVGGQGSYSFNKPVTLTFSFDPAALTPGETPAVYYYDAAASHWVKLGGTVSGSTITVTVDHFTRFAVIAAKQEIIPAPQPEVKVTADVKGHWAESMIAELISKGAISGYPDGTFRPDRTITRAEFATIIVKSLGMSEDRTFNLNFKDTEAIPNWARGYIAATVKAGLISGYTDGTFKPDNNITRAEIAVIVAKALHASQAEAPAPAFTDATTIPAWAAGYVSYDVAQGILSGYPDNTFQPMNRAKRAEACTMIVKMMAAL